MNGVPEKEEGKTNSQRLIHFIYWHIKECIWVSKNEHSWWEFYTNSAGEHFTLSSITQFWLSRLISLAICLTYVVVIFWRRKKRLITRPWSLKSCCWTRVVWCYLVGVSFLLIACCWLPPHLDYNLTQSLPKSVCYWCNKKSCTQVKPKAERLFFLEFCLFGTRTSSQNLSRTSHDVFLADTSPWMPYDVTRTGKGLRQCSFHKSVQVWTTVHSSFQIWLGGTVWK